MKKAIILILSIFMLYFTQIAVNAENAISVTVNGEYVNFDTQPINYNNRILVPVRAIFEKLGAEITWNDETKTINAIKNDISITIVVNNNIMDVSGKQILLDAPAIIVNDRTLIPIRAISEAFNCKVGWDGTQQLVSVISDIFNYTMLYAPNNRSIAVNNQEVTDYLKIGWYVDETFTPAKYTTKNDIGFMFEYINLGLESQNYATQCATNYIRTHNSEYQQLFFDFLRNSDKAIKNAYNISTQYADLIPTRPHLEYILYEYKNFFEGKYSARDISSVFTQTLNSYTKISEYLKALYLN